MVNISAQIMAIYMIRYFQPAPSIPMGLMKVVKNPAPRTKNCSTEIPRDLSAYGKISTI
jgi:hypothetical protein